MGKRRYYRYYTELKCHVTNQRITFCAYMTMFFQALIIYKGKRNSTQPGFHSLRFPGFESYSIPVHTLCSDHVPTFVLLPHIYHLVTGIIMTAWNRPKGMTFFLKFLEKGVVFFTVACLSRTKMIHILEDLTHNMEGQPPKKEVVNWVSILMSVLGLSIESSKPFWHSIVPVGPTVG